MLFANASYVIDTNLPFISAPQRWSTRSFRFSAASVLKLIASIFCGFLHLFVWNRNAAFCANNSVFPAPGPAITSTCLSLQRTVVLAASSNVIPSQGNHLSGCTIFISYHLLRYALLFPLSVSAPAGYCFLSPHQLTGIVPQYV